MPNGQDQFQNFFGDLDKQPSQQQQQTANKDQFQNFFGDLDKPSVAAPKPGPLQGIADRINNLGKDLGTFGQNMSGQLAKIPSAAQAAAPAALSNVGIGLASIPEQLFNLYQLQQRNQPGGASPLSQMLSNTLPSFNQSIGGAPVPYLDITGALRNAPMQGWLAKNMGIQGQTAGQLAAQNPIGSMIGQGIGQAPYFAAIPAATLSKLPAAARVAAGALEGYGLWGAAGAAEEASEEGKYEDQINPERVVKAGAQSAQLGGLLGGMGGGLTPREPLPPNKIPLQIGYNQYPAIGEKPFIPMGQRKLLGYTPPNPALEGSHPGTYRHYSPVPDEAPPQPQPDPGYQRPAIPGQMTPEQLKEYITRSTKSPEAPKVEAEATKSIPGSTVKIGYEEPAPSPKAKATKEKKPVKEKKPKQGEIEVNVLPATPHTLSKEKAIEERVRDITFFDEDASWRIARDRAAIDVTAQQAPLARKLAMLKTQLDEIEGKTEGAIEQFYKDIGEQPPLHRRQLDPKKAEELKGYALALGATPKKMVVQIDSAMAEGSQFPRYYNFTSTTIDGKMEEIRKLFIGTDQQIGWKQAKAAYDGFKERSEKDFSELFKENQTYRIGIKSKKYGERVVNMRYVWRPSEYEFIAKPENKALYQAKARQLELQSKVYSEFGLPGFKAVITQVANKGKNIHIEGLADKGALEWIRNIPSGTQAKIILAIGLTAAYYAQAQQGAEAAPINPKLVGNVIRDLKNGWVEKLRSRPIVRITRNNMTTDMLRDGFDAASKQYFKDRMLYLSNLEIANKGARVMTEAEKEATKGMEPYELRRTPKLVGWTALEKKKAGDILQLNREHRARVAAERARLEKLHIQPHQLGRAGTYAFALDIDAHDMGINLKSNPLGPGAEAVHALNGTILRAQAYTNISWVIDHWAEMLMANIGKNTYATGKALAVTPFSSLYREYAIAQSPPGFFEQLISDSPGLKIGPYDRQKIEDFINKRIDEALDKHLGPAFRGAISMKYGERAKLGFNGLVSTLEIAKDYPFGKAEGYMRRWLDASKGIPIPPNEQLAFDKVSIELSIEKNINSGFVPHGLISERTIFQRTQIFALGVSYKRSKIQQNRLVASFLDDALDAFSRGDMIKVARSIRAVLFAQGFLFAFAGAASVSPVIWFILEALDRHHYGTIDDVAFIKHKMNEIQGHIFGGWQKPELGLQIFPITEMPTSALSGLYNQMARETPPKNALQAMALLADATTLFLTSKLPGDIGTLTLGYFLRNLVKGFQGKEIIVNKETGLPGVIAGGLGGVSDVRAIGAPKVTVTEGVIKGITHAATPAEVKLREQGEKVSARIFPKLVTASGKRLQVVGKDINETAKKIMGQ